MKVFQIMINKTFEEEKALVEVSNGNAVVLMGDYYHDKINERIEGFFDGVSFCGVQYKLEEERYITPKDNLFKELGFYEES